MPLSGQPNGDAHVDEHTDDVVGDGDKGTGSNGRVYLEFLQRHGYKGAEEGGKHHHAEEREAHRVGGGRPYTIAPPVVAKYGERYDGGIEERHERLLQYQAARIADVERVVGKALHHDSR